MTGKRKRARQTTYGSSKIASRQHSRWWSATREHFSMFFPDSNDVDQSQNPPPPAPDKPTSQKAATMPAEPDPEKVDLLVEFSGGMTKSDAVRYLKAKGNDVNAAVEAYYGGEDISKLEAASQWDEGAFMGEREGGDGGGNNDPNQHMLRPLTASAAATRPNSPAPSARANAHPTNKQEEDEDLARALAMSTNDLSGGFQQETGVVGPGGQTFGPATREHYEQNQWAMVPSGGTYDSTEVVPDVDMENRVHTPGEPRLLKHLPDGDYTPNLLTICHAIDRAREALLMPEHLQMDYGQDGEWWKGRSISLPKIVNVDNGSAVAPESDDQDELIAEVQRLMAFLSASDRSYASIGALTQTNIIRNTNPMATRSRTLLELFLQSWAVAASSKSDEQNDKSGIFSTTVGTNAAEGMDTPDMSLIDMQIHVTENEKADLFEMLDNLLWDTDADSSMADNYIESPAEVLVMHAHQANPNVSKQLRMEVPAEFYIDKYLKENIEATRATRMEMARSKKRISKIEEIERKLKTWKHPLKNETLDASQLLKHTLGHFNGQNKLDTLKADKSNSAPLPEENNAIPSHYPEIAAKLESILTNIDGKLQRLAEEKDRTRKALSDMSKAPPPGLESQQQQHRYTLRGVATKPNITYVLCPAEDDEMSADDDTTPTGMRWWRMEYDTRVTKTRTADYDVLRAVELEHSSALLVYARDRPTTTTTPLPQPLQQFVQRDNEIFAAERHPPAYEFPSPRRSVESGSMDSTRAEGGGTPVHEIKLDDEQGQEVEMVERVGESFDGDDRGGSKGG